MTTFKEILQDNLALEREMVDGFNELLARLLEGLHKPLSKEEREHIIKAFTAWYWNNRVEEQSP